MKFFEVSSYNPTFPTQTSFPVYKTPAELYIEALAPEVERAQTERVSDCALKSYNEKHGSNYELVEALSSNGFREDHGIWYHANFKAKDKSVSGEDSPTKLFFAELKYDKRTNSEHAVKVCQISEDDKRIGNCHQCKIPPVAIGHAKEVLHPTSGFQKGRFVRNVERICSLRKRARKA